MKIGTDSLVLGALAPVGPGVKNILDIGTGTGVLALMLAQRTHARITAVELDPVAASQATFNFNNSRWAPRLEVIHADFNTWPYENDLRFDLIISNPPYFTGHKATLGDTIQDQARKHARTHEALSLDSLVDGVKELLSAEGIFYVILPIPESGRLQTLAALAGLHLNHKLMLFSKPGMKPVREVCGYSFKMGEITEEQLIIYNEEGRFSDEYIALTRQYHAHDLTKKQSRRVAGNEKA